LSGSLGVHEGTAQRDVPFSGTALRFNITQGSAVWLAVQATATGTGLPTLRIEQNDAIMFHLFLFTNGAGVEPHLLYQPWMMDGDDCGAISGMNEWQGKPKYPEKTCPSAVLPTADPQDLTRAAVVGSQRLTT
jgi:hypothetical protein